MPSEDPARHIGQPAFVLAGPGTGKTTKLTQRVEYLLHDREVQPARIAALTFTRAAARQLRDKLISDLGLQEGQLPRTGTLHSFALSVLVHHQPYSDLPRPFRMTDRFEEKHLLVPEMATELGWSIKTLKEVKTAYEAAWCTLECEETQWISENEQEPFLECLNAVRGFYSATMPGQVIYLLKKLLDEHPLTLENVDLRHLLVDEYQDLNRCDHAVLDGLAAHGAELFAVGDDDQSIYTRLRHAHPQGVREFPERHPDCAQFGLEITYRCPKSVVTIANRLISHEPDRLPKNLRPRDGAAEGTVRALQFRTNIDEAAGIAELCRWSIEKGVPPQQICILVSRWALATPVCEALASVGVPFRLVGRESPVAEGTGRLAYAVLRIATQPTDSLAWRTWLHFHRGIGPGFCLNLRKRAMEERITLWEAIRRLAADVGPFGNRGTVVAAAFPHLSDALSQILRQSATLDEQVSAAIDYAESLCGEQPGLRESMQGLIEAAEPEAMKDLLAALADPNFQPEEERRPPKVVVMSMSSAKGLSFHTVIVPGLEQDLIPTDDPDRINEYRRLLYVSVTRTKDTLFMTHAARRSGSGAYFGSGGGLPVKRRSGLLNEMAIASAIGHRFIRELA